MKRILESFFNNPLVRKALKYSIILVVVLFSIYTIKSLLMKHFIGKFQQQMPWVTITHPKQQRWVEKYHTVGQLSALQTINISPKEPGIVEHIFFKPGQEVKKDDVLIGMENANEIAQFNMQKAEYQLQKKLYAQYTTLYHEHNISKTQYWQTKASFKKAMAAMEDAKARLEHKQIHAAFSGIMGIPEIHVGQYISPGQQHIATLQKVSALHLDFRVPERYFNHLIIGRTIQFTTQDHQIHYAHITAIEPASESNAHTIWVRARVDNQESTFLPGAFVNVSVPVSRQETSITVPQTAILTTPRGPTLFQATQKDSSAPWELHQIHVKVGQSKHLQTIILSQLDPKSWIVDSGTQKVRDLSFAQVKEKHE
jgi:membrane fusion protein (multidrug efflux system)